MGGGETTIGQKEGRGNKEYSVLSKDVEAGACNCRQRDDLETELKKTA